MRVLLTNVQTKKILLTFFDRYRLHAYRIQGLGASGNSESMTPVS